jgi:hypothetical protein
MMKAARVTPPATYAIDSHTFVLHGFLKIELLDLRDLTEQECFRGNARKEIVYQQTEPIEQFRSEVAESKRS